MYGSVASQGSATDGSHDSPPMQGGGASDSRTGVAPEPTEHLDGVSKPRSNNEGAITVSELESMQSLGYVMRDTDYAKLMVDTTRKCMFRKVKFAEGKTIDKMRKGIAKAMNVTIALRDNPMGQFQRVWGKQGAEKMCVKAIDKKRSEITDKMKKAMLGMLWSVVCK